MDIEGNGWLFESLSHSQVRDPAAMLATHRQVFGTLREVSRGGTEAAVPHLEDEDTSPSFHPPCFPLLTSHRQKVCQQIGHRRVA